VHDHWIGPQQWLDEQAARTQSIAAAVSQQPDIETGAFRKKRSWWQLW